MTTHEFAAYIHAYCDGELEASKMLEMEGHLRTCSSCRQSVEAEQAFREVLRSKIAREPVPPNLAERLRFAIRDLDEREKRPARPPAWDRRAWLVGAAASILVFVLGGVFGYLVVNPLSRPGLPPLVTELVSEHMKFRHMENPAELTSRDRRQVAFWVQGRVGYSVRVPDYSATGFQLLGGRVMPLGGRQAGYIMYEKGRGIISLFAFPRAEASLEGLERIRREGRTFLVGEYKGQQILLLEDGNRNEMTYALVSDMGWDELFQCARAFFGTTEF